MYYLRFSLMLAVVVTVVAVVLQNKKECANYEVIPGCFQLQNIGF